MKNAIILFVIFGLLGGCRILYQGLLSNHSTQKLYHYTDLGPNFWEPIPSGSESKIRLFHPGACITLKIDGNVHHYKVPDPPKESEASEYRWNPTYLVDYSNKGLCYQKTGEEAVCFEEVAKCQY